jgi:hypothetical protein|tara:strand:- start:89 stop:397 length:309 start_codon:yes stop_codon:yes gene_type:complete
MKKLMIMIAILIGFSATAQATEPKFKCLSAWDGSYPDLKRYTKKSMKDPKSFDHRETRITPIVNGHQNVFMQYAGRNSFGGMVIEYIGAKIRNSDCKLISII